RIEGKVDSGAGAHFEGRSPGRDAHALDGRQPAGVQRGPERPVVRLRDLVVDRLDKRIFVGGDRQIPAGQIAGRRWARVLVVIAVQERHAFLMRYPLYSTLPRMASTASGRRPAPLRSSPATCGLSAAPVSSAIRRP